MKILIIGGTGTIGKAVAKELELRHEVVIAGTKSGDVQVDIGDINSIRNMYKEVTNLDAVVLTVGNVHFTNLTGFSSELYQIGLQHKLMGQVNVVLEGIKHLNKGGSFTLTSGILNNDPIVYGSSAAMVNGALDGFVKGAAIEMPNELRINIISPTVVTEALEGYGPYFRGFESVASSKVALAYSKSVEGAQTGQIYTVWG